MDVVEFCSPGYGIVGVGFVVSDITLDVQIFITFKTALDVFEVLISPGFERK